MKRLLIANRSEIACRIIRTAHRMGIQTVAIYSEVDKNALHVQQATFSYELLGNTPAETYLHIEKIIQAAVATQADAIHPGYGFLSENPDFAQAVIDAGMIWIGPSPACIRLLGSKAAAKRLAKETGVPCLPGYDGLDEYGLVSQQSQSPEVLLEQADQIHYPVMIKAINGGGGRGMRKVEKREDFLAALQSARHEAKNAFNDDSVLLERALHTPHHIEVQIFADQHGHVVHLGERDCSVQRRHQKIIEESPSPVLSSELRERICQCAVALAKAANYYGAGTVEFLLELQATELNFDFANLQTNDVCSLNSKAIGFYFMEMNTRLQVEHPVTEMRYGIDLVEWQIKVANSDALGFSQNQLQPVGHAVELRLCAEDALFIPQTGKLLSHTLPNSSVRIDHALHHQLEVSPFYDSMLGKWIVHGNNRNQALQKAHQALAATSLLGIETNLDLLQIILSHPNFQDGNAHIHWLNEKSPTLAQTLDEAQSEVLHLSLLAIACFWSGILPQYHPTFCHNSLACQFEKPIRFSFKKTIYQSSLREQFSHDQKLSKLMVEIQDHQLEFSVLSLSSSSHHYQAELLHQQQKYILQWVTLSPHELFIRTGWGHVKIENFSYQPSSANNPLAYNMQLRSPMSGKVLKVLASIGEHVTKGQCLLILESMKLEQQLVATQDGYVEQVFIQEGEQANSGQILLKLSASPQPIT